MKYIITEDQYERLAQEEKILELPDLSYFNNDWNSLQEYLKRKGNPKYSIMGNLELYKTSIESLGNLTSVGGNLNLTGCKKLTSLGNLTSVGGILDLKRTPISRKYSRAEIRQMVKVDGDIYL